MCIRDRIDPVPLVVGEVVIANIGGSSTLVGDPPNVILGTQLGFGFNQFAVNNGPIAIFAALIAVGVLFLMQRKNVTSSVAIDTSALSAIRPERTITNKWLLRLGLGALIAAVTLLITHEYIQQVWHIPITDNRSPRCIDSGLFPPALWRTRDGGHPQKGRL